MITGVTAIIALLPTLLVEEPYSLAWLAAVKKPAGKSPAYREIRRGNDPGHQIPDVIRRLTVEEWIIAIIAFALLAYLFYALLWPDRF